MPRISMTAVALAALAATVLTVAGNQQAQQDPEPTTFIAVLNAGQASLLSESESMGVAFATFDEETKELCVSLSYDELESGETAAHIHGPAEPGENADIVFDLSEPLGSPKRLCVGPVKPRQRRQLRAGLWYLNIHSEDYFQGEIRGQIVPVSAP